jgi:small conductance mechanosensitive channel
MSLLYSFLGAFKPFVPTGVAIIIVILVIAGTRYIIERRSVGSSKTVRRQVLTILLSFIGLLIVIMIIPDQYLSETSRGQLLSLIGILLSAAVALSSTTLIGNAMAGLMLRSIKSFRPGDFVRVADHFGRVTARGLFHVEIQTEDRDLTTIPNLYMVTNPVKVILASGTIVSAEVSLGYDVSHADVEESLIEAAGNAGLSDPFVLVTDLGDYSVTYRASGLLAEVRHIISVRSKLRRMMMDSLHQRGIEIVSPAFMNTRALPEHKTIMPRNVRCEPSEEARKPAIEKLFFDIAEEAASTERLNEMLAGTLNDIDSLKDRAKETQSDEEKEKIKHHIEQLDARQERIRKLLEITAERKDK